MARPRAVCSTAFNEVVVPDTSVSKGDQGHLRGDADGGRDTVDRQGHFPARRAATAAVTAMSPAWTRSQPNGPETDTVLLSRQHGVSGVVDRVGDGRVALAERVGLTGVVDVEVFDGQVRRELTADSQRDPDPEASVHVDIGRGVRLRQ